MRNNFFSGCRWLHDGQIGRVCHGPSGIPCRYATAHEQEQEPPHIAGVALSCLGAASLALATYSFVIAAWRARCDPGDVAFVAGSYAALLALFLCLRRVERLTPDSPAAERRRLHFAVWALCTELSCAFAYRVSLLMPAALVVAIWCMTAFVVLMGFYMLVLLCNCKDLHDQGLDDVAKNLDGGVVHDPLWGAAAARSALGDVVAQIELGEDGVEEAAPVGVVGVGDANCIVCGEYVTVPAAGKQPPDSPPKPAYERAVNLAGRILGRCFLIAVLNAVAYALVHAVPRARDERCKLAFFAGAYIVLAAWLRSVDVHPRRRVAPEPEDSPASWDWRLAAKVAVEALGDVDGYRAAAAAGDSKAVEKITSADEMV
ncbi:hypothetical protein EJB05_33179, partial [Eragrostis curvula]